MQNQPIMNLGTTGHVSNGKSTITKCISGKATQQFEKEKERNITIRLGYANTKIWKCMICDEPHCYCASASDVKEYNCPHCNAHMKLINHVSIVDCPGHNELTSTMLNGSAVMDYAFLVEATNNQTIPAPQTAEHLSALIAAKIPIFTVVMNKVELYDRKIVRQKIDTLKEHIEKCQIECPPFIPMSATLRSNVDVLCQYIGRLKIPKSRDPNAPFKMIVIRSFDVNKPGQDMKKLNGGVIGGTILRGKLKIGDRISIFPGIYKRIPESEKKAQGADFRYEPITGEVLSIKSENNNLDQAIAGGLLGIQLTIDPAFTRNDHLSGSMVLKTNDTTDIKSNDDNAVKIYDKVIIKVSDFLIAVEEAIKNFTAGQKLMINVNSNNIDCEVMKYSKSKKELYLFLKRPIAIDSTDNVATIMSNEGHKNILGRGSIIDGVECEKL